jgi:NodT family efflux transporter outer membrane factor (OMF) lipoprotein
MQRKIIIIIIVSFLSLVLAVGCKPKQEAITLPFESSDNFSIIGADSIPEKFWLVFGDTSLNKLIDSALLNNFTLLGTWERLRAARAVVDRESSNLLPDLEAFFGGTANRGEQLPFEVQPFSAGLTATYEIDIWGRIRSQIDAEKFRAEAAFTDYRAGTISLAAVITTTWFRLLEARNQLEIISAQEEYNQKVLNVLKNRFGSGQVRSVDILRQNQLLESTREQKTYAEAEVMVLENQLSILVGKTPMEGINYQMDTLPALPPLPETGIPLELVERRPDVQSSFYLLKAADRDLAAAISNKYPRLTLSATAVTNASQATDLFENWAFTVAGNLLAPLIYGGRLRAEVDRNEAIKNQRLYEYAQSVLIAYQEVEDALIREQNQKQSIQSIEQQLELAEKTSRQLRIEYLNGLSNYIDVLVAMVEEQQLKRDLLAAKLTLIEYRISLYRALAGGFETEWEIEG